MLPKDGMILGGTLTLRGNNLTLGCFHGINFRSKSWAIFTMCEPYICFATEAQKTIDEGMNLELCYFNPLTDDNNVDQSKLKQIANDILKCI